MECFLEVTGSKKSFFKYIFTLSNAIKISPGLSFL